MGSTFSNREAATRAVPLCWAEVMDGRGCMACCGSGNSCDHGGRPGGACLCGASRHPPSQAVRAKTNHTASGSTPAKLVIAWHQSIPSSESHVLDTDRSNAFPGGSGRGCPCIIPAVSPQDCSKESWQLAAVGKQGPVSPSWLRY